jgi:hypothetical protein
MYALDSKTGKQKWMFQTFGSLLNNDTIGFDRKAILSSVAALDDAIFIAARRVFFIVLTVLMEHRVGNLIIFARILPVL